MKMRKLAVAAGVLCALGIMRTSRADDVSAIGAGVQNYVTGTMDGYYAWFEQGFDPSVPTAGLPAAGVVKSEANANWRFRLQPYNGNNVQLLSGSNSTATMTFARPKAANAIAIADATSIGPALLIPTIHFSDGTHDFTPNFLTEPDWFQSTGPIFVNAKGRIQINNPPFSTPPGPGEPGEFNNVVGGNPVIPIRIDTLSLPDSLASHPIASITMSWTGEGNSSFTDGATAIFAISTSTDGGTTFAPADVAASSFNKDLVVEAAALPEPASSALIALPVIALVRRRRCNVALKLGDR